MSGCPCFLYYVFDDFPMVFFHHPQPWMARNSSWIVFPRWEWKIKNHQKKDKHFLLTIKDSPSHVYNCIYICIIIYLFMFLFMDCSAFSIGFPLVFPMSVAGGPVRSRRQIQALKITRPGKHTKKRWKDPPFWMGKCQLFRLGHFQ